MSCYLKKISDSDWKNICIYIYHNHLDLLVKDYNFAILCAFDGGKTKAFHNIFTNEWENDSLELLKNRKLK